MRTGESFRIARTLCGRAKEGALLLFALALAPPASAQCPQEPPLFNYNGGSAVVCPCFIPGEEAGVVLNAPAAHYPIEILKIRVGWASQFGGSPQTLEQALHLYAAGLPNPGAAQFSLPGPLLTDGFINEFDISATPGNKIIGSGPFTIALEFLNTNAGQIFSPSVYSDGNGCQGGKNVIFAIPGGWTDACTAGVTGDWVMEVIYRPVNCPKDSFFLAPGAAPQRASVATLTGARTHALRLGSAELPVLGATWGAALDCAGHGGGLAVLFAGRSATAGGRLPRIGGPLGELFVDLSGELFVFDAAPYHGVPSAFAFELPDDPGLAGTELFVQGLCQDGPRSELTNGLRLTLGR